MKEAACETGIRSLQSRLLPHYTYNFEPEQLMFLCQCLDRVRDVPGAVVEIGCAAGRSTIFLNRFMQSARIEKNYICVDTFSGFTERDLTYEVERRGKMRAEFGMAWADWSVRMFQYTMAFNRIERVQVVKADINDYDFSAVARIAFCLVDVDLYRPVKAALNRVYERLSPGGIIVVDDCVNNNKYDGALEAYREFVRHLGISEIYRHSKFGVIEAAPIATARRAPSEVVG